MRLRDFESTNGGFVIIDRHIRSGKRLRIRGRGSSLKGGVGGSHGRIATAEVSDMSDDELDELECSH